MKASVDGHPLSRFLFIAAALAFLVWGISQAQAVVVSSLVSIFLALLGTPPVLWLERRRVPVMLAVALVVASMVLVLLVMGVVVGTSINSFYGALPQYQVLVQQRLDAFSTFLADHHLSQDDDLLVRYFNPGAIMSMTASLLMRLASAFSNMVLVVLTTTFILLEVTSFPVKLRAVLGDPEQVFPAFTRFINDIKRYMVMKTLISTSTGILITGLLLLLRVDFAVLWGFLGFMLNYVPSLGSLIASVPAVFLAFLQYGPWRALLVAVGYVAINFALDYAVEPRLLGRRLGLSTLVVFLSLIFWGSVLGPVGAVLCVPLTMALKFALESSPETRWLGIVLGPEVPTADAISPAVP